MDTNADTTVALARGLAGYVRAVARELGLPAQGTSFEISDTATAYLGLSTSWAQLPGRDLMLVWNERDGWSLSVETRPTEDVFVIAQFGNELLPSPSAVARFVTSTLSGLAASSRRLAPARRTVDRGTLATRLQQYIVD
ncbi:MAG TPA: DUF6292 family protein [Amycolatopsis sp.]|nr:DUF6292 family protein [Amycolatopsis sp.]